MVTAAPRGSVYEVGGISFDGFADGVLLEAKGPAYAKFVRDGKFRPWFTGVGELIKQAKDQVRVAGGTPVGWVVAEPEAAAVFRKLFEQEGMEGIDIVVYGRVGIG